MKRTLIISAILSLVFLSACKSESVNSHSEKEANSNDVALVANTSTIGTVATTSMPVSETTVATTSVATSTKAETTAPISVTSTASTSAPKTASSKSTTKAETTAKTTAKTTQATTSAPKKSGHQKAISDELVRLVNQYRKDNGLSVSTSTGGWQNHADRFTKFFVEQGDFVEVHGLGIHEVWAMNGGASKNIAQSILTQWKNSEGHNEQLLWKGGAEWGDIDYSKYIYSSVYYSERTGNYIAIVGLMDRTYEEFYPNYESAVMAESWYENGGRWSEERQQFFLQHWDDNTGYWDLVWVKNYYQSKGYKKYYPHLA